MLIGCAEFANSGYGGGGYQGYPSGYSSGYDDNSYERRELERERWRLEQERREIREQRRESERRREDQHDRWRDNDHNYGSRVVTPPPPPPSCPSGFSPRGSKCSDGERRKGCRDTRNPGGSGYCIGW